MGYIMAEEAYKSRKWYAGVNESAKAMRSFLPLQHGQPACFAANSAGGVRIEFNQAEALGQST